MKTQGKKKSVYILNWVFFIIEILVLKINVKHAALIYTKKTYSHYIDDDNKNNNFNSILNLPHEHLKVQHCHFVFYQFS